MEYFKRDSGGYTTNIDPLRNYYNQAVKFTSVYAGVDIDAATIIVKELVRDKKTINPIVTYLGRNDNGDREKFRTKLSNYISDTVKSKNIITPSLTVYDHPSKKKSLHSSFLGINIAKRSKHKKLSLSAYQDGKMDEFVYNDVLQRVMKTFNNSFSGAYASMGTILYNPSQHYTLTSMTRSVASIGNAVTESVVAGNKNFYTPEAVVNYITAIISTVDIKKITSAIVRYNIKIPSVEEVNAMLLYSSDRYYTDADKQKQIVRYLKRLTGIQLASIMYVNDLFHLRKYNDALISDFIGSMANRVTATISNPLSIMNRNVEGINNLVHHICMDDIRGMQIDYTELSKSNPKLLMILAATAENIYRVLDKYKLLLKAFFVTDILPIDVGNIRDCYRDSIVLSDTDSTCGSYDYWTQWYFGNTRYTKEAVALSACVMTINTQVIDHNIKVFAKNMNIADDAVNLLKMKNEYFWSVFITANVSKHYFANTIIREYNVYAKPMLELKGVHLIASGGNQDIVNDAHSDMCKALTMIETGGMVNPRELIKQIASLERTIVSSIERGEITMYKLDQIKDPGAYKLDNKSQTPYFGHIVWSEVFSDEYGYPGEPVYSTIKIPTVLKTKSKLSNFIAEMDNEVIKGLLTDVLGKYNKQALGTFRIPLSIASGSGIPKEIMSCIDIKRVVLDNMNIYYIFLETLGIYRKQALLFSEMGY